LDPPGAAYDGSISTVGGQKPIEERFQGTTVVRAQKYPGAQVRGKRQSAIDLTWDHDMPGWC